MDQNNIHHEDVLMKMFMYSLEGDARVWYISLPSSNISSLREFHATFNEYCKRYFPTNFILVYCCEQCKSIYYSINQIQEVVPNTYEEEDEEYLVIHKTFSHFPFQEEVFQDVVDDRIIDTMIKNSLDSSNNYFHNEYFVLKDEVVHLYPFFENKIVDEEKFQNCDDAQDIDNHIVDAGNHTLEYLAILSNACSSDEIAIPNLNEEKLIFDGYLENEQQFSKLLHMKLLSNQPAYDNYKEKF
jgi:hypothetical protein